MPAGIEVATVDHGLRPESADEAAMVSRLCAELGVPHVTLQVEVAAGNLQAKARTARYAALSRWAGERDLDAVSTAHHADDQAETLLMRLNRGSGLAGLAGVRPMTSIHGVTVVRPLFGWRKAELEGLVAHSGIQPVRDRSNEDASFDRVRIRETLATVDWLDPVAIARSASLLAEAEWTIEQLAHEEFFERAFADEDGYRYHPGGPLSIMIEVVLEIFGEMGSTARRSEIARLIDRLIAGEPASLGGILVRPGEWQDPGEPVAETVWRFEQEPPRSVH